jgi:hypothetical protein
LEAQEDSILKIINIMLIAKCRQAITVYLLAGKEGADMYLVNKQDGYIHSVVSGVSAANSNITEAEYIEIKAVIENMPTAPTGFGYRLKENLEWELYELPEIPEAEATEQDYIAALEQLGVYAYA